MRDPGRIAAMVRAEQARAEALFDDLRRLSFDGVGITRPSYSEAESRVHEALADHARMLGLEIGRDFAANTYMTMPGRNRDAPAIIVGSHLDSVKQGGNFDGAAGVVGGLVALAALHAAGIRPPCDVRVMGVRAEESAWFDVSYIGSRAALGRLPAAALAARRVDTGRDLASHIAEAGGEPERIAAGQAHLVPGRMRAFLELHIEQGPLLESENLPVGIVTGIPGNFRHPEARVRGEWGHVGLLRDWRRDALLAAAEFALALDALWADWQQSGRQMAATIGRFGTDPALHALTKVPGEVVFSLDMRTYATEDLAMLEREVQAVASRIAARRGVEFRLGPRTGVPPGPTDPVITAEFERIAGKLGIRTRRMGSPASHDAAAFAAAGVPIAMLFTRNANGSHNPAEAMRTSDFLDAAAILACWIAAQAET